MRIGANVKEAIRGQTKPDFDAKMNMAVKAAGKTEYWLALPHETEDLAPQRFPRIYADCQEPLRFLRVITKTRKGNDNA